MLGRFLAGQLACPSGLLGKWLLPFLWNWRNATLNDVALDALSPGPTDRILEIGFGGGYLLGRLSTAVTTGFLAGIDVSQAMVDRGRRHLPHIPGGMLDLRCARAEALPFDSGSFTKVCSVNSMFYWDDPTHGLAECYRVLTGAGRLVLCLTCPQSLRKKRFTRHGLKLYEPENVERRLAAAGFEGVSSASHADSRREFFCVTARRADLRVEI